VIGSGHNGLIIAAYLICVGRFISVLECRGFLGGATVTESDLVLSFCFSCCNYLLSVLRRSWRGTGSSSCRVALPQLTACLDGRYLLVGLDAEMNLSEITKFSSKDAMAYPMSQTSFTCVAYLETILTWIRFGLHFSLYLREKLYLNAGTQMMWHL
jgi:phytoene dehydrogenase-like protein